jgi:hypothetical protein
MKTLFNSTGKIASAVVLVTSLLVSPLLAQTTAVQPGATTVESADSVATRGPAQQPGEGTSALAISDPTIGSSSPNALLSQQAANAAAQAAGNVMPYPEAGLPTANNSKPSSTSPSSGSGSKPSSGSGSGSGGSGGGGSAGSSNGLIDFIKNLLTNGITGALGNLLGSGLSQLASALGLGNIGSAISNMIGSSIGEFTKGRQMNLTPTNLPQLTGTATATAVTNTAGQVTAMINSVTNVEEDGWMVGQTLPIIYQSGVAFLSPGTGGAVELVVEPEV